MKRIILAITLIAMSASAKEKLVSSMYADRTARQVGDLVTIMIQEASTVKKDASNSRDKGVGGSMEFDFPGMEVAGDPVWKALTLPEWSADAGKQFSAKGSKSNSEEFSASITVHITEVLPNGNMMIMGDRKVNIDGDIIQFKLTGMIRPDDISRSNMVLSSKIAGAAITYETVGEFSKSQEKGLFSRAIDWIFPF